MERRVAGRRYHPHTLHDLLLPGNELDFVCRLDRRVVAVEVAGGRAFVRVCSVLVFAALDDVGRVRKTHFQLAVGTNSRISTGVIEVEMGVDHQHNVRWPDPHARQSIFQHCQASAAFVLETVDVLELLVLLVAGPCVDEDESRRMLYQQAPHAELYSVTLVGRDALFPERLGNDAEHRPAIQLLPARLDRVNGERADCAALDQRGRCRHAVVSRVTDVGMPERRRFLRRPG